jgi:hypothetical protein
MVKRDSANYNWCEDGIFFENKSCGMYACTSQVMGTLLGTHEKKNSRRIML